VIYSTLDEIVYIAERATGGQVTIRDAGLLEAAAARPQATAFGADAYPDLHTKAAALVHSVAARNHALVDGNKAAGAGRSCRVLRDQTAAGFSPTTPPMS